MAKRFMPGLKYVFTKKKFIKKCGREDYKFHKEWINKINGKLVTVINSYSGESRGFFISYEYCKCIGKE